jgi:hypothetical protein
MRAVRRSAVCLFRSGSIDPAGIATRPREVDVKVVRAPIAEHVLDD